MLAYSADLELAFCIFFVTELLMRMLAYGPLFFLSDDIYWNMFDTLVVSIGVVDQIMTAMGDADLSSVLFLRIMRIIKLVRVIRIVRVFKIFRELRILLQSVTMCMRSLFWTLVMLFVVIFIFGIYLALEVAQHIADTGKDSE